LPPTPASPRLCDLLPCPAPRPGGGARHAQWLRAAGLDLNGPWHVIIDPYETGYYDYRRQPLDAAPEPKGGYFLDQKPASRSELLEYNFDQSPVLNVPGDWNSQNERLYYYEGSIWYRRLFDYRATAADHRLFLSFARPTTRPTST